MSDLVTVRTEGPVAVVTHDDGKANVYSHDALVALGEALDAAERDGVRAVVLTGRPGVFSAGFDLKTMTASEEAMRGLVAAGAHFLARLFTFPAPVVVAAPGHALAAGALVLLSADVRIGADVATARIGLNEVAIGMPLPQFALDLARYRMPPSRFDGALLGRTADPATAVVDGFLDRVVDADALAEEALQEATALAELRTGAVGPTKRAARGPIVESFLAGLDANLAAITRPG